MDKFGSYVVAAYVVTFVVLIGYLVWLWWRLRQERGLADAARDEGEGRGRP
ncbi:MAG: heme exporter protein CcmD [Deinococcus sp.]